MATSQPSLLCVAVLQHEQGQLQLQCATYIDSDRPDLQAGPMLKPGKPVRCALHASDWHVTCVSVLAKLQPLYVGVAGKPVRCALHASDWPVTWRECTGKAAATLCVSAYKGSAAARVRDLRQLHLPRLQAGPMVKPGKSAWCALQRCVQHV